MKKTSFIKLSEKLAPVIRKLSDVNINLLGRDTEVLKITKGTPDVYGVSEDTYSSEIINNIIIKYPLSEVEIFDETENTQSDTTSISLMDILPIEVMVRYEDSSIYPDIDVVGIESGDILVDILRDENNNKIPIRMEVKRLNGEFFGRDLVKRLYQCTLIRGTLDSTEAENLITEYISNFE